MAHISMLNKRLRQLRLAPILLLLFSGYCFCGQSPSSLDLPIKPHIRFVCTAPSTSAAFILANEVFSKAFNDWGYTFELVYLPYLRAIAELASGNIDGDCGRVDHPAFRTNPNVIYLDVPILQLSTYLWYYNDEFSHWHPNETAGQTPRIATLRGIVWGEDKISDWSNVSQINVLNVDQGLKMLQTQRADLLIASDYFVQSSGYVQSGGHTPHRGQQLGHYTLYPLLHVRHQALVPKLTAHLNALLADPEHPLNKITTQLQSEQPDQ